MQRILNKDKRAADLLRRRPELLTDSMMVPAFTARSKRVQKRIEELFSSRDNLVSLMEILQREDWRQMRAYLTVLKEYLPVLDADKQDIILDFLYDMLSHQSGMVRRIAARTYGYLLAFRHREYGYDPGRSIHRILFPGTTVSLAERRKINYQLKYVLLGYDELADERSRKHVLNHYAGYFKSSRWDKATCFYLIMGITDISCDDWSNLQKYHIFSFLRNHIRGEHEEVRLAALYLLDRWLGQGWKISDEIRQYLLESGSQEGSKYCERYLIARIHNAVTGSGSLSEAEPDYEDILTLFQENQHSHALWINKILNLSILKEYFYRVQESGEDERGYGYQYANHLINMLRLNKQAVVFLQAGSDLTEIMPGLQPLQKFEIVKDILQSLENIDDYYNFTAPFAGRAFLTLDPADQMELIPRLWELADRSDAQVVNTSLEVVAEILKAYYPYMNSHLSRKPEEEDLLRDIDLSLCSILSTGMASYKPRIAKEAFFLTGQSVFAQVEITEPCAMTSLLRLARKALISLSRKKAPANDFYNYTAIKHVADNLAAHAAEIEKCKKPRKIAFFSGSFDPFSRGHKAIAQEVARMGYTVYLDTHDFAWYKKLQPKEIRRQIMYLSISDLESVLLFPKDYPVSIENPEDLAFLRSLFPGEEVTIVTGSDVIENCEAYWKEPCEHSIHTFPHIIFQRGAGIDRDLVDSLIQGETLFLRVPSYYDSMTSLEIQKQIALGRDISGMVDKQVKNYVLDQKLYRDEPIYKKIARTREVEFIRPEIGLDGHWLYMEETKRGKPAVVSAVSWRESSAFDLTGEDTRPEMLDKVRETGTEMLLEITGIYGPVQGNLSSGAGIHLQGHRAERPDMDNGIIVCNELLASYQKEGWALAVYLGEDPEEKKILQSFGFVSGGKDCLYVDLRHPVTMFYDADSFIKEPYYGDELIKKVMDAGKNRIREVLPLLYPGDLILQFDAAVINHRMIRMITMANHVAGWQEAPVEEDGSPQTYEHFGKKMCVTFGKLLKGVLVPNTVTRELYVEKLYANDLHTFEIREFPDYAYLRTQIRTVKSFRRPAIFVDDLFHKGFRMQKIGKLLKEEGVETDTFIVGVLSGQGRMLAEEQHLEVEAPYYVPGMQAWIVESDLYPFVGGDGIMTEAEKQEGLTGLPSTNLILPYQLPAFLKDSSLEVIYQLSETALVNGRELFQALEKLYQREHLRSLTFGRIGEVMAEPRYPEGTVSERDNDRLVSEILAGEQARLRRLRALRDMPDGHGRT